MLFIPVHFLILLMRHFLCSVFSNEVVVNEAFLFSDLDFFLNELSSW